MGDAFCLHQHQQIGKNLAQRFADIVVFLVKFIDPFDGCDGVVQDAVQIVLFHISFLWQFGDWHPEFYSGYIPAVVVNTPFCIYDMPEGNLVGAVNFCPVRTNE